MMANQRETLAAVNAGTAQAVAATNQSFHDITSALGDKYTELQRYRWISCWSGWFTRKRKRMLLLNFKSY